MKLWIVAGDIADGMEHALRELLVLHRRTGRPIVFVSGNHDLFGQHIDAFDQSTIGPIYMLPGGERIVIDGVHFVGATLWTNWQLIDREFQSPAWAARSMPEYNHVYRDDGDLIWPIDTSAAHDRHRGAIERVLATPHAGPTVVVTHHVPTPHNVVKSIGTEDAFRIGSRPLHRALAAEIVGARVYPYRVRLSHRGHANRMQSQGV